MSDRVIVRGTAEYLTLTVVGNVTLDAQAVEFSFDKVTWITAAWQGSSGTTRKARIFLEEDDLPTATSNKVYVRITDDPEIPILIAGTLIVRD